MSETHWVEKLEGSPEPRRGRGRGPTFSDRIAELLGLENQDTGDAPPLPARARVSSLISTVEVARDARVGCTRLAVGYDRRRADGHLSVDPTFSRPHGRPSSLMTSCRRAVLCRCSVVCQLPVRESPEQGRVTARQQPDALPGRARVPRQQAQQCIARPLAAVPGGQCYRIDWLRRVRFGCCPAQPVSCKTSMTPSFRLGEPPTPLTVPRLSSTTAALRSREVVCVLHCTAPASCQRSTTATRPPPADFGSSRRT